MHDENTDKSNKNINVSNEFVDIFKNFNVVNKVEEMKLLSKKELYLLLTLCLDKHDDTQPTVVYNFQQFREEVMELFEIQDDKETLNPVLQELIKESGDKNPKTPPKSSAAISTTGECSQITRCDKGVCSMVNFTQCFSAIDPGAVVRGGVTQTR
jgi:Fe-S-cluster formation regulator IscX/YfhJ